MFNPYYDQDEAECRQDIKDIRARIKGVRMASHAGTGSAENYDFDEDVQSIKWLAQRLAQLTGEDDPTVVEIRAYVIDHVGDGRP